VSEKKKLDLSAYAVRTDLAIEAKEMVEEKERLKKKNQRDIEGVITKEYQVEDVKVSSVKITHEGEKTVGKKAGNYLTFHVPEMREQDSVTQQKIAKVFAKEFSKFLSELNIPKNATCFIVGLGNWNVTPDS